MKLQRPSPALAVSGIALVLALGGTATAASLIGTGQLKNNAVTSAKIKNATVQGSDIKDGSVGPTDLSKATLKRIDKGAGAAPAAAPGGATASELVRKSGPLAQPANVQVKVATLNVPAGAYAITAKTTLSGFTPEKNLLSNLLDQQTSGGGNCQLDAGGNVDQADTNIIVNQRPTPSSISMQLTSTFGAATDITLNCAAGTTWSAGNTTIIAVKLASVSSTNAS